MNAPFNTCLLIDDSQLDNFINSKIIQRVNFADEIIISEFPEDALNLLLNGTVHPDVIFLDIRMPIMDGFQFLTEYDKMDIDKEHTKIFMLSSSIDPYDINRAESNKYITKYLTKSLTPNILMQLAS
ncbi:response regulator [Mucilaginibacter sp. UYCu711]|uniref:response regulator n=1 Tax=Mucilaginibacter sp. UYCu711 TaxID=3156339 RepID=UPI003D19E221